MKIKWSWVTSLAWPQYNKLWWICKWIFSNFGQTSAIKVLLSYYYWLFYFVFFQALINWPKPIWLAQKYWLSCHATGDLSLFSCVWFNLKWLRTNCGDTLQHCLTVEGNWFESPGQLGPFYMEFICCVCYWQSKSRLDSWWLHR